MNVDDDEIIAARPGGIVRGGYSESARNIEVTAAQYLAALSRRRAGARAREGSDAQDWEGLGERYARKLGVWAMRGHPRHGPATLVSYRPFAVIRSYGNLCACLDQPYRTRDIDAGTLLLLLIGHDRGERVGFSGGSRRWVRAMLDAMARPCVRCDDDGYIRHADGEERECWECWGSKIIDGDEWSRDALLVHAYSIGEDGRALVVGDWMQQNPGRPLPEFPLPPEGLGALLEAWLRGSCEACDGKGQQHEERQGRTRWRRTARRWRPGPREKESQRQRRCKPCNGRGVALGAHDDALTEMVRDGINRATRTT